MSLFLLNASENLCKKRSGKKNCYCEEAEFWWATQPGGSRVGMCTCMWAGSKKGLDDFLQKLDFKKESGVINRKGYKVRRELKHY